MSAYSTWASGSGVNAILAARNGADVVAVATHHSGGSGVIARDELNRDGWKVEYFTFLVR